MNDMPRHQLSKIIADYGRSVCDDIRQCEGLLRDYCGEYRREVAVLVSALKERVPTDLLSSQAKVPRKALLAQLTKRLQDNLGLSEDAACWAVESWALALGVLSSPEYETFNTAPERPAGGAATEVIMRAGPSHEISNPGRIELPPVAPSKKRSRKILTSCFSIALVVAVVFIMVERDKADPTPLPLALDGEWKVEWWIGADRYNSRLRMTGVSGTMTTKFFSQTFGRALTVEQTMRLKSSTSSDEFLLSGANPIDAATRDPIPPKVYAADTLIFQRKSNGSIEVGMCDDRGVCAPVRMQKTR
jgi:hypothetical protein